MTTLGVLLLQVPVRQAAAAPLAQPPLIDVCFVETSGDGATDDQSPDSGALQTALAAAVTGTVIKIAGNCAASMGGQTALVEVPLTLRGGYSTTNWLATANPAAHPTYLDALYDGYVVKATAPVTLENLILQNGFGNDGAGARFEAAALLLSTTITNSVALGDGGGIYAVSSIVMISSTVVSNTANNGGGAYFAAAATITGTTFQSNTASVDSGGGAFFNAPASVYRSQFLANSVQNGNSDPISDGGGAIFHDDVLVKDSLFRGNSVQGAGGNLSIQGPCSSCRIERTRIIEGSASAEAGGMLIQTNATLWLVNNLFANNVSPVGDALWFFGPTAAGTLHVVHNTFYGSGQEIAVGHEGFGFSADVGYFTNTVLAGNNAALVAVVGNTASGAIRANGLLIDTDAGTPRWSQGDVEATNAITGSAGFLDAANLDFRMTGAGVDAGINAGVAVDIDGAARPLGSGYDLGAFEYVSVPACFAETTGDNTADFSSTNASALQDAVSAASAGGTVKIAGVCKGAQALGGSTQTMLITKSLTLIGGYVDGSWTSAPTGTATIDANQLGRAISASAPITVQNLVFRNGNMVTTAGNGGAVLLQSGGRVVNSQFLDSRANGSGGALYSSSSSALLVVSNTVFERNTQTGIGEGGALASNTPLQVVGSQFYSNTAEKAGGLYASAAARVEASEFISNVTLGFNGGGAQFDAPATVTDTLLQENTAYLGGGGIYATQPLTLVNSTVLTNTAAGDIGGGVYVLATSLILGTRFVGNLSFSNYGGAVVNAGPVTIRDGEFIGNQATSGGALYSDNTGDSLVVEDSRFERNIASTAAGSGAAIFATAANLRVVNSDFYTHAASVGAAITTYGASSVISNVRIVSSTASDGDGGAIVALSGVQIYDTVIEASTATGNGGAIYNYGGPLILRGSTIDGAAAGGDGGGAYSLNTVYMTDTTIGHSTALTGGGAAMMTGGSVVGSVFVENRASLAGGGGLYVKASKDVAISGTQFLSNTAYAYGGGAAIAANGVTWKTLFVTNTEFISNTAGNHGGGLHVANNFDLSVLGSRFERNAAGTIRDGAGLYAVGGFSVTARIADTTFDRNVAGRMGGGVYIGTGSATATTVPIELVNDTFTENRSGWSGGGAYLNRAALLTDTTFTSNTATIFNGGGVYLGADATLKGITFLSNTAVMTDGGALYGVGALVIDDSEFRANGAGANGGALRADKTVTANRSRFIDNTAPNGQIYVSGTALLVNNIIAGADATAGIVAAGSSGASSLNALHNTIVGSGTAVQAGSGGQADVVVLTNTIIAGSAVGADATGTASIALRGVLWQTVTTPLSGTASATSAVTGVAKFVDAAAGNYLALGAGVDAGVNSGVTEDIRGEARPKGAGYDLGAYEVGPEVADASLGGLTIHPGTLTPAFVSSTARYTAAVANTIETVDITPTVNVTGATYVIMSAPGTCTPTTSPANCTLSIGSNVITVVVTALNGAAIQTYTVEIVRTQSNDASLGSLEISPGALTPAFVSDTTNYTAAVPNGTTSVAVTATVHDVSATVAYTSSAGACDAAACAVAGPTTRITVTVTAADGATKQEYVVEVTVADAGASTDASLGGLEISPGTLAPAFVSNTTNYAANVPNGTTSVAVTATTSDVSATVAVSSSAGSCAAGVCTVAGPKTWITVTVTAADGVTKQEYVIEITVAAPGASTDASLGSLEISPGALTPAFVSDTTNYAAAVPNGTTSVAVTATTSDVSATVAVASSAGVCDAAGCAIAGPTTWITVTVTAADGATKQEYVIEMTVAEAGASTDASLGGLEISPGTLTPAFVSDTTNYAAAVPNGTTSVAVTATTSDVSATVAVASSAGACDAAGCAIAGPTTWITVTVTAADGVTKQEYVIEVTVAAPLTTIGRVWPTLGVPEGGMPVTLLGTGFSVATGVRVSNSITNVLVPFTVTGDGRIDFVMPAGVDGTWADITVETASESTTVTQAFWYQAPVRLEFDGQTGAVVTLTNGMVITVPSQGVSGTFVITLTPLTPEPGLPGTLLLHVFQLEALLDSTPVTELMMPATIALPVDSSIVPAGEQPWLYQWTTVGNWAVVRGQQYDAGSDQVKVSVRPTGLYALSTVAMWSSWFPQVPLLK